MEFETAPHWFHTGQMEAWGASTEVVLVLAGRQSGKTVTGPKWLLREIQRCGAGDYAIVGPTLELLKKKALPEFLKYFEREEKLGTYNKSDRIFHFSPDGLKRVFGSDAEPCCVFVGYATKPDSLESATYKGVWADEAGQTDFKQTSWEALEGRRAVHNGRILVTTTPYAFNWLKTDLYDRWIAGDPRLTVVRFESCMNPQFSQERFEAIRSRLPAWKFDLFYRAVFVRPAGAIFDCFDPVAHTVKRRYIPRNWIRYQGIDFGNVNTASNWAAMDPVSGVVYVYRSYHDGSKSAAEHVHDWTTLEDQFYEQPRGVFDRVKPLLVPVCYGGAPSENDWRAEFSSCGLGVNRPPFSDVETGIQRVYALLKMGRLKFFDDLKLLIGEIETYSRRLNEAGEPLAEIEDKSSFHRVDALRYLCSGVSLDVDEGVPMRVSRGVSDGLSLPSSSDEEGEDFVVAAPGRGMRRVVRR
jgi:hypothetical protein